MFERMTSRAISKADINLPVKSPNIYNGNNALRGLSVNEHRFDNINKQPEVCTSTVKAAQLPGWNTYADRNIDFSHKIYNHNVYRPQTSATTRRVEVGYNDITKKQVPGQQALGDYCLAQAGSGYHID